MENRTYSIVPYDSQWVVRYTIIREMLELILEGKARSVEHVGSTSIPGMKAKPLIDVLVIVETIDDLEYMKQRMISRGYILRISAIAEHSLLFEKMSGTEKIENIHVFEVDAPHINQFLNVRDYLRAHPKVAEQYSSLKEQLKAQHPDDYYAYRPGKAAFLEETARLANEWVQNRI